MRHLTKPLTYLTAAACASACGSLAPDTSQAPVLATIHGELQNKSLDLGAGANRTRVAVLWHGVHGYSIAEDLPVQSEFPARFVLQIRQAPPADAIWTQASASSASGSGGGSSGPPVGNNDVPPSADAGPTGPSVQPLGSNAAPWPADFGIAFGSIVAYEDLNSNGKLDLVDAGATSYVDRILGANSSLALVYVQGTFAAGAALPSQLNDDSGHLPVRGFNLFHLSQCPIVFTPLGTPGGTPTTPAPPCTDKNLWLAPDSLFLLPLTADPKFATLMCKGGVASFQATAGLEGSSGSQPGSSSSAPSSGQSGGAGSGGSSAGPPGSLSTPPVWVSCGSVPRPNPPPANWPCPKH